VARARAAKEKKKQSRLETGEKEGVSPKRKEQENDDWREDERWEKGEHVTYFSKGS